MRAGAYGVRESGRMRAVAGRMRAGRARAASDYAELFRLYCHIYCVKSQGFFLCYSRKVAKTELYNERKRGGRKEEGEIEKAACSAGAGSVLSAGVGAYASGGERYIGGAVLRYDLIALSLDQE